MSNTDKQKAEAMHKVALVLKELIGDRSIRRTAEDTGVAASYITGILKERYLPSAEILRKLAASDSNPKNGVVLEDLMVAAGYQNRYIDYMADVDYMVSNLDEGTNLLIETHKQKDNKNDKLNYYKSLQNEYIRFENSAIGVICRRLMQKGFSFVMKEDSSVGIRGFRPDMVLELQNQPVDEWWFDFKYFPYEKDKNTIESPVKHARNILGGYIFIEPNPRRKISVVMNNATIFNYLKGYIDKLAYRGELSVILLDDNSSFVEEVYLSHYEPNSADSEFIL